MTTPTPTGDRNTGLSGAPALPAALDPAALTLIANQLLREPPAAAPLPGGAPQRPAAASPPLPPGGIPLQPQANPLPPATALATPTLSPPLTVSQPAAASAAAVPTLVTPRLLPTPAQTPDAHALHAGVAPALPRDGGPLAGVPALATARPTTVTDAHRVPGPAADTPFYFLREANAPGAAVPSAAGAPGASPAMPAAPAVSPGAFYFLDGGGAPPPAEAPPTDRFSTLPAPAPARPQPVTRRSGTPQFAVEPARAPADADGGHPAFDVSSVRRDFPMLREEVNGRPLVWLDNAATTQKPQAVIDRIAFFYEHENSNVHRGAHAMAARATDAYEDARQTVADFLGAGSKEEIVFVRGATEGINLIAQSYGRQVLREGDEIVLSHLEHHANIVPWQMVASATGARLRVIPVDDRGQVRLDEYQKLLGSRTRIVAVTHVSNALGTIVPIKEMIELAHRVDAKVVVDGAQSVSHMRVDMRALDVDFFVFSAHKVFGPTGVGAVFGKHDLLAHAPPYHGGGNMIIDVTFDKTVYQPPPARFEAGTGSIADAVGMAAALDYVERLGLENIARYEHELLCHGLEGLRSVPGLHLIGDAAERTSAMSFVMDGLSPEEVAGALNTEGMAVRAGHHCAQPILRRFGVEATVRPSLAFYNTHAEVDLLVDTLRRLAANRGLR